MPAMRTILEEDFARIPALIGQADTGTTHPAATARPDTRPLAPASHPAPGDGRDPTPAEAAQQLGLF